MSDLEYLHIDDVVQATGVPKGTLLRWAVARVLKPKQVAGAPGVGYSYGWLEEDLPQIRVAYLLIRELGMQVKGAARIMDVIREKGFLDGEIGPVYLKLFGPEHLEKFPIQDLTVQVTSQAEESSQIDLDLTPYSRKKRVKT